MEFRLLLAIEKYSCLAIDNYVSGVALIARAAQSGELVGSKPRTSFFLVLFMNLSYSFFLLL